MEKLRIDKYLADMGLGTRTEVKELIKKGFITFNGEIVRKPEIKVEIEHDKVCYQGRLINYTKMKYIMLNKPMGVLTATEDKRQKTVLDLLDPSIRKGLFPVGRLDKDTEGLLLITNDGALAHQLLSPKKHVPKKYFAIVSGIVTKEDILLFAQGFDVLAYKEEKSKEKEQRINRFAAFHTMPAELTILETDRENNLSKIEIEIYEGKFHQVKRMCETIGKPVLFLKRISMGGLRLDPSLHSGQYRRLTEKELNNVKSSQ